MLNLRSENIYCDFGSRFQGLALQVTEATYGREYQLQAMMDTPSEKYGLRVRFHLPICEHLYRVSFYLRSDCKFTIEATQ